MITFQCCQVQAEESPRGKPMYFPSGVGVQDSLSWVVYKCMRYWQDIKLKVLAWGPLEYDNKRKWVWGVLVYDVFLRMSNICGWFRTLTTVSESVSVLKVWLCLQKMSSTLSTTWLCWHHCVTTDSVIWGARISCSRVELLKSRPFLLVFLKLANCKAEGTEWCEITADMRLRWTSSGSTQACARIHTNAWRSSHMAFKTWLLHQRDF